MDSINEFLNPSKLKLVTFREIARKVPKPFRWAIVWILLEIEPKYIAYKAKKAIDLAVKQYRGSMPTIKISTTKYEDFS